LAEQADAGARQLGAGELHRIEQLDAIGGQQDHRVALVGAAVLVLVAVDRLGLVGALVFLVGDAVVVVVRIGATVEVLEAVLVLGLVGALVLVVGDAVAVVVLV